jgi:hypothetical protein
MHPNGEGLNKSSRPVVQAIIYRKQLSFVRNHTLGPSAWERSMISDGHTAKEWFVPD